MPNWSLNIAVAATPTRYKLEVISWWDDDLDYAEEQSFPRTDKGLADCRRFLTRALTFGPAARVPLPFD